MLASHLLDTIPSIMREWRKELHTGLPDDLSINQFRVLFFVKQGHSSACYLAKHLGVTAAALSKMAEGLVEQGLLKRSHSADDRRHIKLEVTKKGDRLVLAIRKQVEQRMQSFLDELTPGEQQKIETALTLLNSVFTKPEGLL